jgi:predicted regulator of Ras-like GTPase activity (Roadblock/LC7/MglB family)
MAGFDTHLRAMVDRLGGALAATLMGADGIPVETVETSDLAAYEGLDLSSLLVEYSSVLTQVQRTGDVFAAGPVEELTIRSERLTTLIRPVTSEYFVALALGPTANTGKGRFLLRVHGSALVSELS